MRGSNGRQPNKSSMRSHPRAKSCCAGGIPATLDGAVLPAPLQRSIGPSGYFAIAFGSIVGSGWVLVLGDWLHAAGPGGSIVGFAAGGAVMILVAACYGELAARMPRAGGEFVYALHFLGAQFAFAVAWFLTLYFAAFTAFEGIALAWILGTLFPQISGPVLYSILGAPVAVGGLAIGILFAGLFALLNAVGTKPAVAFQRIVTFGFMALVFGLIVAAVTLGHLANARPLFPDGFTDHWLFGAFWIFSTTAVFLNGFQTAAYAIEERRRGTRIGGVIAAMILGVFAAVAFYLSIIAAVSIAAPWHDTVSADLPAAFAFGKLTMSGSLGRLVLVGAAVSLLKSWNAYVLSATRLIFAQAREGFLPAVLSRIHPRFDSPTAAIAVVFVLNAIGIAVGRGAIVPIVNMCAICLTFSFVLCLGALLRANQTNASHRGFKVPGGQATIVVTLIGTSVMAAAAVYEPLTHVRRGVPLEWQLLAFWSAFGMLAWLTIRARVFRRQRSL
jgi:basic amino acid/polyamine antiporter, APA family